jgi:hypothetical protein
MTHTVSDPKIINLPAGKGVFEWCILDTEKGDPEAIATEAVRMGFGHVLLHIVDGYISEQNVTRGAKLDPYAKALQAAGVECWGWGAIYPKTWQYTPPIVDAAARRLGLAGFVIDAEGAWEVKGSATQAAAFMSALRALQPTLPLGLSSYRWPSVHGAFPWAAFREHCDFDMPQVYWEIAHNPVYQLTRSRAEFSAMSPSLPFVPTFPLYKNGGWTPTAEDVELFLQEVKAQNLPAVNAWDWFQGRRDTPAAWEVFQSFAMGAEPEPTPQTWEESIDTWARGLGYNGPRPQIDLI